MTALLGPHALAKAVAHLGAIPIAQGRWAFEWHGGYYVASEGVLVEYQLYGGDISARSARMPAWWKPQRLTIYRCLRCRVYAGAPDAERHARGCAGGWTLMTAELASGFEIIA